MFQGSFIVTCTLFAFIGLVWLREQILHGGGPEWLEAEDIADQEPVGRPAEQAAGDRMDEAENNNVKYNIYLNTTLRIILNHIIFILTASSGSI